MFRETCKTKLSTLSISLLVLAIVLTLSACGSNSGTATVTSVMVSPTSASVDLNTSITLVAVVNLSNTTVTTNTAVTWQVNGVGGGNSQVGTIVNSPDDVQEGVYTAPSVAPSTNNGQVMITATAPQVPSSTTNTNIVTSNTAIITVGVGQGLAVTPTTATVPAGGTFQFSALLNSLVDSSATWAISSTSGGNIGTINPTTGLYTAPPSPPPGATITVTATDSTLTPAVTATATATIVYSDLSLSGQFAFSYSGNDQNGFLSVAGSFATDGAGHVTSGIEDVDSFTTNGWTQYQIPPNTSTYKVGTDGRGTILLNPGIPGAATLQFALTSNQHAMVIRFDRSVTGSGTIDQQNLNDTSDLSAITGPYVFSGLGADTTFSPLGIAGKFTASGNSTNQTGSGVVDLNDNGATTQATSLNVSYALDSNAPDTGRGKMTISSAATAQRQFAFYIVDATHLYFVEIDNAGYLQGNMYSAATGTSFSAASLVAGNYAFIFGGNSPTGAFAAGGVFASGGNSNITGGVFDSNNAGTVTSDTALGTCPYTVDPSTGRILLGLCPTGSSTLQFAAYQTEQASSTEVEPALVMLELDPVAISIGSAYSQKTVTQFAAGSFALLLGGQGVFHDNSAAIQQDLSGQTTLSASAVANGNLDINNFNSVFQTDPISPTDSSILAPDSNGRGTATIVVTNPNSSYDLAYYLIDANTALLFDTDASDVLIGTIARQF
ncbi:MAG TPA: hypothetical protein VN875_08195 [Candidatus Binatus sp.]|nr:hypothetical protein [Candidatus Binatus sp.]